jgi:hypothetical protein
MNIECLKISWERTLEGKIFTGLGSANRSHSRQSSNHDALFQLQHQTSTERSMMNITEIFECIRLAQMSESMVDGLKKYEAANDAEGRMAA